MAAPGDDDAFAATRAPVVDPSAATMASTSDAPPLGGDAVALGPVDPASYVRGQTLAVGGMGQIIAARDRRLGRPVALKEVRAGDPALRSRFAREAQLTARLQHPNIITVHEAGTWPSGEPFFAMKLVAGRSLDKVVAEQTTLAGRIALLPVVIAVADALAYAHRERVIHRDLKPGNVLVGDFGETVVIDWGLAKDLAANDDAPAPDRAASADGETAFGAVLGTPAYMAPEQARGEPVDARADVYALGALLYHVLSGRAPVEGPSVEEVLARVAAHRVPPMRTRDANIPQELETIASTAMAAQPEDRYPSAVELAADLRRYQTGQLVGAHRYTPWQLLRRWARARRTPLAVAAVALVVLACGGAYGVWRVLRERDAAEANASRAEVSASSAAQATRALLLEEGRREVLAEHPLRALALLAAARDMGEASTDLRFLLGQVLPAAAATVARADRDVLSVQLSADERHVIAATRGGELHVMSSATLASERTQALTSERGSVVLGPTAELAVLVAPTTSRGLPMTQVWDARPGAPREEMFADVVAFDETGARVWRLGPFAMVHSAGRSAKVAHPWAGNPLVARAHGEDLLVVTDQEIVRLHDAGDTITTVARRRHDFDGLHAAAISADLGRTALVGGQRRIVIADADGRVRYEAEGDLADVVAIREDGSQVAALDTSGDVQLITLTSDGATSATAAVQSRLASTALAYSADGHAVLAQSADAAAYVLDAERAVVRARLAADVGIRGAVISRDGARVVAALADGRVVLWATPAGPADRAVADGASCVTVDARGRVIAVHDYGYTVDGAPGRVDSELMSDGCSLDPSGAAIALASDSDVHVRSVDVAPRELATVPLANAERFALGARGHRLYVVHDGAVRVFDDGRDVARWPTRARRPDAIALSADETRLSASYRGAGWVDVYDVATGAIVALRVTTLDRARWAPARAQLLTSDAAGVVTVWDAVTGAPLGAARHTGAVRDATFAPDGDSVLTASVDGVVRQWSLGGELRRELRIGSDGLERIAVPPSGDLLAVATEADEIAVWSLVTGSLLTTFAANLHHTDQLAFDRTGARLLALSGRHVVTWATPLADPAADAPPALLERAVPWRVEHGRLVDR